MVRGKFCRACRQWLPIGQWSGGRGHHSNKEQVKFIYDVHFSIYNVF